MKTIIITVLLTLSAAASAGEVMYGDWGHGVNGEGTYYAGTVNASKSSLGQLCSSQGNCGYIVSVKKVKCADGEKYAGLISSALGANHVNLVCSGNRYLIEEFDLIDATVRNASSVGIVSPLENGEFSVSRFSLAGSTRAVDGMRATIQRAPVVKAGPADIRI